MSVLLNVALFVGVFYLIIVYAGLSERPAARTDVHADPAPNQKRVA